MADESNIKAMAAMQVASGMTEEEVVMLGDLNGKLQACDRYMFPIHKRWYRNIAFASGNQQVFGDSTNMRRLTVNHILPILRRFVAKITKSRPSLVTIPATTEKSDVEAARVSDKALDAFWWHLRMSKKLRRLCFWIGTIGQGHLFPFWNAQRGEVFERVVTAPVEITRVKKDEDGNAVTDSAGEIVMETITEEVPQVDESGQPKREVWWEGDVDTEVVNPFEVFVYEPGAKDIDEDATICFRKKWRPMDYVKAAYPKRGKYAVADSRQSESVYSNIEEMIESLQGPLGSQGSRRPPEKKDGVIIKQAYMRPTLEYKKGRMITFTANLILDVQDELPYPADMSDWAPFIKFCDVDVPWSETAVATTTMLIPLQVQYNSVRSQIAQNIKMHGNIKLVAPDNSIRTFKTNNSADIMTYKATVGPPKMLTPPSLSNFVLNEPDRLLREFEDISGQSQVSKGRVPTAVSSGLAIAYLTEQDDTMIGPNTADIEDGLSHWGTRVCRIVKTKYVEKRVLAIVGTSKIEEVVSFMGKDFRNSKDVICQPGSLLPGNKIARQEFVFRLMNSGYFQVWAQNPPLARKISKLLEFGGLDGLYEESSADIEVAQDENTKLSNGKDVLFTIYDDHFTHKEIHQGYIKSKDGRAKLFSDQRLLDMFLAHLQQHDAALASQVAQQSAAAKPMTSAQNGPGADGAGGGGVGDLGPSGADKINSQLAESMGEPVAPPAASTALEQV